LRSKGGPGSGSKIPFQFVSASASSRTRALTRSLGIFRILPRGVFQTTQHTPPGPKVCICLCRSIFRRCVRKGASANRWCCRFRFGWDGFRFGGYRRRTSAIAPIGLRRNVRTARLRLPDWNLRIVTRARWRGMNCALTFGATAGTCHSAPFARRQVEAGGVEPPSEKRYGPKTTCLALFRLFRQPRSE